MRNKVIIDPTNLAERVKARLNRMTPEERKQAMIDAGIFMQKGNVKNVYKPMLQVMQRG